MFLIQWLSPACICFSPVPASLKVEVVQGTTHCTAELKNLWTRSWIKSTQIFMLLIKESSRTEKVLHDWVCPCDIPVTQAQGVSLRLRRRENFGNTIFTCRSQGLRKYVKGDSIEESTLPVKEEKGQALECSYTVAINCSQHFLISYVKELFMVQLIMRSSEYGTNVFQCSGRILLMRSLPILITSRPIILNFIVQNIP